VEYLADIRVNNLMPENYPCWLSKASWEGFDGQNGFPSSRISAYIEVIFRPFPATEIPVEILLTCAGEG